jgi:hypothetical protein
MIRYRTIQCSATAMSGIRDGTAWTLAAGAARGARRAARGRARCDPQDAIGVLARDPRTEL